MSDVRKKITFKAPQNGYTTELMPKTSGDQVYLNDDTPLTPKIAEMVSAINLRAKKTDHIADVETLNETIDTKVADAIHNSDTKNSELKTYVDDSIAALNSSMETSHTIINNSIAAANADILLRAKQADVDSAISTLSNSVDSKLAEKANSADVDTKINNLKQEILGDLPAEAYDTFTELAAYIAEHQEISDSLSAAIETKANKTDVDTALSAKANISDVENALVGKVNTSDLVDPGNGTVIIKQGGQIKGSFTLNQSENATIELLNDDTVYSTMVAASKTEDGQGGMVPAPTAGEHLAYLRGDGTWSVPTDTKPTLEALGISATAAELNYMGGVTSNVQVQLDWLKEGGVGEDLLWENPDKTAEFVGDMVEVADYSRYAKLVIAGGIFGTNEYISFSTDIDLTCFDQTDEEFRLGNCIYTSGANSNNQISIMKRLFKITKATGMVTAEKASIQFTGNAATTNNSYFIPWYVVGIRRSDSAHMHTNLVDLNSVTSEHISILNSFESSVVNAIGGYKLSVLTQTEYDALETKDSNTIYIITD